MSLNPESLEPRDIPESAPVETAASRPQYRPAGRLPFMLSGFLALLAFPPINLWPVAWMALLPLIRNARGMSFTRAFRRGWWAGLVFNAGLLYWIALNTGAGGLLAPISFLGMLLVYPLYWGLFTGLWAFLHRRWGNLAVLLLPGIWVGLELFKNLPEIGFPWQEFGLSQVRFLPVAQVAEIGGIRLVSAWVVGVNAAVFLLLAGRRRVALITAAALFLGLTWGIWRMYHLPPAGPEVTVMLVQGNVDPEAKWQESADSSLAIYQRLTRRGLGEGKPDLVLWPETAIPAYLGHQLSYQRRLRLLAKEARTPILTGAPHYELKLGGGYTSLNSAFFFPGDGTAPQRYDKIRLVPFGERVPFQKWFPELGELNFGQAEFTPGKEYAVFDLPNGVRLSPQICFESVFGPETRRYAINGARALVNLTNDGWYGNSSGPYQHAALVQFRSIETRYPLFRAANTGISLAVDRVGRVVDRIPWAIRDTRTITLETGGPFLTFYVKHGELINYMLAAAGLLGLLLAPFVRFGRRSG